MKINILAISVLTALSARAIKKVEGGIMMRALQANLSSTAPYCPEWRRGLYNSYVNGGDACRDESHKNIPSLKKSIYSYIQQYTYKREKVSVINTSHRGEIREK